MAKINIGETLGKVGNGVMEGFKVVLCAGLIMLPFLTVSSTKQVVYYDEDEYGFGDAVKAIMSSSMFSHEKTAAVDALVRYADSDYYSAVISIVESSMFSHEKVDAIRKMSSK